MIANIANRDPKFTYIPQVIGNHLASTELSMAKHRRDPDILGFRLYILDKEGCICSKGFIQLLYLMQQYIYNIYTHSLSKSRRLIMLWGLLGMSHRVRLVSLLYLDDI